MQIIVPISCFGTWLSTRFRSLDFVIPNDFLSFECSAVPPPPPASRPFFD